MAKEKSEKTNLYLLSIVGIVAVVGITVMLFNGGFGSVSIGDSVDISGQVISASEGSSSTSIKCTDTDGGSDPTTKGGVKGRWYTTNVLRKETDYCKDSSTLYEYYCKRRAGSEYGSEYAYYVTIVCEGDELCDDGACISRSD